MSMLLSKTGQNELKRKLRKVAERQGHTLSARDADGVIRYYARCLICGRVVHTKQRNSDYLAGDALIYTCAGERVADPAIVEEAMRVLQGRTKIYVRNPYDCLQDDVVRKFFAQLAKEGLNV